MRVLLFATARDAAGGRGVLRVDPPSDRPPTLEGVLDELVRQHPRMRGVLRHARVAVNGTYVEPAARTHPLSPTDEVAVLPPYSGG